MYAWTPNAYACSDNGEFLESDTVISFFDLMAPSAATRPALGWAAHPDPKTAAFG